MGILQLSIQSVYIQGAPNQLWKTYGVPSYKEANPAFFATVTFPFLFGVMFGDIAHGLLILLLGLYLTLRHGQVSSEWGKLLLPHRYMILLMGFFRHLLRIYLQ
jgi:V-type H+-transporting ATPase subunit a